MDALAGYGSDDDSSSASSSVGPGKNETQPVSSLSGLLGDVSDASEDEPDTVHPPQSSEPSPSKKAKVEVSPDSETATTTPSSKSSLLPEPILSKDENDSWIYWKVNYLQRPLDQSHRLSLVDNAPSIQELQDNLQRLTQNSNGNNNNTDSQQNWADRLRSQHEFHNPHFFASVVEHFGIRDPLGSAIPSSSGSSSDNTEVRDYERKLFPIIVADAEEAGESSSAT